MQHVLSIYPKLSSTNYKTNKKRIMSDITVEPVIQLLDRYKREFEDVGKRALAQCRTLSTDTLLQASLILVRETASWKTSQQK